MTPQNAVSLQNGHVILLSLLFLWAFSAFVIDYEDGGETTGPSGGKTPALPAAQKGLA